MHQIPAVKRAIVADTSLLAGFAWTTLTVAVLTAGRWLLDRGDAGMPFAPFFPFILLAAVLFGWRSGVLAAVLSAVAANRLLRPDPVLFYVSATDAVMVAFFCGSGALLIYIGEQLRRLVRELEEAKSREQMLSGELLHRGKNTLAIVNALAALTRRNTAPHEFFASFSGRIEALNRATDLLAKDTGALREVTQLIDQATAPFRSNGNFRLSGPACAIPQTSCVPLMLVLHELCTNAAKHGALAVPEGMVVIEWDVIHEPAPVLHLRWRERGGPAVVEAGRRGMGSTLMRAQKGMRKVELRLPREGAECDIEVEGVSAG